MITSWHCNYSVPLSFAGIAPAVSEPFAYSVGDCIVTGTSTEAAPVVATTTPRGYDGLNISESLFLYMVLIFFVALTAWPRLSINRKINDNS